MKELEDTNCENRRIIELQSSIWDRLSATSEDEQSPGNGANDAFESIKPLGGFLDGTNHAWLSFGNRLIVLNARTGESVSSWNFRYRITAVSPFPTQAGQLPLLLIGLDNDAQKIKDSIGMICVFNCTTSRILRVIRVPCGVEQICVISGGSEWEELCDEKVATIFGSNSGVACVALRNFDYLIIDLQRSSWDNVNPYLVTDELSPYEIELPNSKGSSSSSRRSCIKEKHSAYSLINSRIDKYIGFNRETFELMNLPEEKLTTSLINSKKIGCLIAGCLGRVILWQSDGSIGWISPKFDDNMSVSHLALIEPVDDPRPFYYLWITCEDDSGVAAPVLRMYAMLFDKKSSSSSSDNDEMNFKLEGDPSLKFEIELDEGDTISCLLPIERENIIDQSDMSSRRGEESLLLIGTNNRMLLFDLNQWYREQMPLTASECSNQNSILASYRTGNLMPTSVKDLIVSTIYVPSSIKEFVNCGPNVMEELFFPNSLSFEWIELSVSKITFWLTRGVQADLLRKIVIMGPVSLIQPIDLYHRCIAAGLVPFNVECSFNSDHNKQREMLLSLCLEQGWSHFLVKCAKEWSDGSASYLFPAFIRWSIQRGTSIKIYADQLSASLFDQSGTKIGEAEAKILRFCCQQLECLSIVVNELNGDSIDFIRQQRALKRVANYFQVLLWFHDMGLLPELLESDDRICYPYQRLMGMYRERREKLNAKRNKEEDCLFIDNLINRECSLLKSQWEKEGVDVGSVGEYPAPSLQSLIRCYLADCHEDEYIDLENKHQIIYYFLLDLSMFLKDSCAIKNQLIKYPAAFKLSPSLIKLVQAFWLLDHEDYQGFLDVITMELILESDIKDWHHQLVIKNLVHENQHKMALIYLRVRKPPLMSVEEQETVISLSVEYGLVQSAFHCRPSSHYSQLLMRFFRACKIYGKLAEILHLSLNKEEEDAFIKFLEEDKCEETKLIYYLQRSRHLEASQISSSSRFALQLNEPISLNMFKAYNNTLPDITRRFTNSQMKKNSDIDDTRYPRPMSHARSYNRVQGIYDTVIRKAKETFNRGERIQVPFVSAPCMSLKIHPPSSVVNCVQFMEKKKRPMERKEEEDEDDDEEIELTETKRIKLSQEQCRSSNNQKRDQIKFNKSLDKSTLGIDALFNTPLVKCKTKFTNPIGTSLETPHSILKIRQLIRLSDSSSLNNTLNVDLPSEAISEKKPRQIRFSVSQLNDDSFDTSGVKAINDSKEIIDEEPSEISEEHFFSPSVSVRSEESSILSDTSITYPGPRPRPGLQRRSANLSLANLSSLPGTPTSHSISSKDVSNSNDSCKSYRTKEPQSIYSSPILSDSSYDENFKTTRITKSMSFTCVVKTVVEEMEIVNENNEELNDTVVEDVSIEELDIPVREESNISHKMSKENDRTIEINSDDEVEINNEKSTKEGEIINGENVHDDSKVHEDTNRNILPEGTIMDHSLDNDGKELEGESSDELEMLPLKDYEDDVFESLSNSTAVEKSVSKDISQKIDFSKLDNESTMILNQSLSDSEKIDEFEKINPLEVELKSDVSKSDSAYLSNYNTTSLIENPSEEIINQEIEKISKRRVSLRNTPVREIRTRRASSIVKENLITDDSSKIEEIKKKRETRSQKTPENIDESTRETRAQKVISLSNSKIITTDEKISKGREIIQKTLLASQENLEESSTSTPRRSRRASSVTKIIDSDELEKKAVRCKTPLRETKRKNEESQVEEVRTRRGSSLAKEILSSTLDQGNKSGGRKISIESEVTQVTPKRGRPKKIQEISSQEIEKEVEETSRAVRRNTRRAASVQKDLTCIEEIASKTQESTILEPVEIDTTETIKRTTRSRRGNSVTKEVPLPRLTRGASLTKEIVNPEPVETVRQTRRRGNSVPKEISLVKTKRSSEKINEEASNENEESEIKIKNTTEEINIPPTRKRTRCPSVQSIPEEVEEILNLPTKSKSTRATAVEKKKKEILPRSRRAASVDLPSETKRYTRSTRLKESDVILEESREEEEMRSNSRVVRQHSRRKRAASETSAVEEKKEEESKVEKPRRGRKASQKDDASSEFAFSPPEQTSPPKDKKGLSQVHNFVFSPPHTRSKQTSLPPRYKSFKPILTEVEMEEDADDELSRAVVEEKKEFHEDCKESRNPIVWFVPTKLNSRNSFTLGKSNKR
ncbi:protein ELYS isoform X2 [Leptopilina boulardi]|uniref:protein ELYS isoform X2 n=1 Tax=Leptopilina boulardi TaxID=63433 RepID=UPI0021F5F0C2|nr:protein ELYS isoform X2 [Leptopilina boulardi]